VIVEGAAEEAWSVEEWRRRSISSSLKRYRKYVYGIWCV